MSALPLNADTRRQCPLSAKREQKNDELFIILPLFLRANYALRWVNIIQAEKMCDGARKPFGIFDQKQSNDHSQSEKEGQSDQGHDGLPQIVVGRFCVRCIPSSRLLHNTA
jgi:hypothetical protein